MKKTVALLTEPSVPRIALSLDLLRRLAFNVNFFSFTSVPDFFMILIMTVGMLRGSEAAALLEEDVELKVVEGQEVLMILVQTSKTYQLRIDDTVFVAAGPDKMTCPIEWFKIYRGFHTRGAPTFFHSANATDPPSGIRAISGPTTNTALKKRVAAVGVNPSGYGSHSCRRGGTTAAVNAEVDIFLVERHGRWKSDAVYSYVDISVKRRLMVSIGVLSGIS